MRIYFVDKVRNGEKKVIVFIPSALNVYSRECDMRSIERRSVRILRLRIIVVDLDLIWYYS